MRNEATAAGLVGWRASELTAINAEEKVNEDIQGELLTFLVTSNNE